MATGGTARRWMGHGPRLRWLGVVAIVGAQLAWMAPASAAPVVIPGCAVTNASGEVEDFSRSIDTDTDSLILDAYADGDYFPFHDWFGPLDLGVGYDESAIPPVCGVLVHRDGDAISFGPPTWLWCTELDDHVCGTSTLEPMAPVIDEDQMALIGWVLRGFAEAGDNRQDTIYLVQNRIWCITDGRSGVDSGDVDGSYVDSNPSIETCDDYRAWLDTEIAPGLARAGDTLVMSSPAAPTPPGVAQVHTVTSSVARLVLTYTGVGTIAPCGAAGSLVDGVLTVVPGEPTDLCVTSTVEGTAEIALATLHRAGLSGQQYGWPDESCQVFITSALEDHDLAADGTSQFLAGATTTLATTSTTSASSSTTILGGGSGGRASSDGSLARTGSNTTGLALTGGALVIGGLAVVLLRRRLVQQA